MSTALWLRPCGQHAKHSTTAGVSAPCAPDSHTYQTQQTLAPAAPLFFLPPLGSSSTPLRAALSRHLEATRCAASQLWHADPPPRLVVSIQLPAPAVCSFSCSRGPGRPGPAPPVVPRSAVRRRAGFGNPTRLVARSFAPRSCAASLTLIGPRAGGPGFGMPFLPSRALPVLVPPSLRGEMSCPGSCYTR